MCTTWCNQTIQDILMKGGCIHQYHFLWCPISQAKNENIPILDPEWPLRVTILDLHALCDVCVNQ